MKIITPYNEILPRGKAHDLFLFRMASALGFAGGQVCLLCGKGSWEKDVLQAHYGVAGAPLELTPLPILRKNNPLNLSWNLPFFWATQSHIERAKPDLVYLSVRKQGEYHLKRKVRGVSYLYEAHELDWYPAQAAAPQDRPMLQMADAVVVTTQALANILRAPPYSLTTPIFHIPLAAQVDPLAPLAEKKPVAAYVGQLYEGQGVDLLLQAVAQTPSLHLKILGGKPEEVAHFTARAYQLGLAERTTFFGYQPPHKLAALLQDVHFFVAPFTSKGRMPYVAHTKLLEYAEWGRPIIAPKLPCVLEDFKEGGVLFFEQGDLSSLAQCLQTLLNPHRQAQLQAEILRYRGRFSFSQRAQKFLQILN